MERELPRVMTRIHILRCPHATHIKVGTLSTTPLKYERCDVGYGGKSGYRNPLEKITIFSNEIVVFSYHIIWTQICSVKNEFIAAMICIAWPGIRMTTMQGGLIVIFNTKNDFLAHYKMLCSYLILLRIVSNIYVFNP